MPGTGGPDLPEPAEASERAEVPDAVAPAHDEGTGAADDTTTGADGPADDGDEARTGAGTTAGGVRHARHATEADGPVPGRVRAPDAGVRESWGRLRRVLAPRATRAQALAALLCALLGFAVVVQLQQNREDGLSGLRQDELVRVLDEVTRRSEELEAEVARLRQTRAELVTGTDTQRAAHEAAVRRAEVQGILAGALPATGPGIELRIGQGDRRITALTLYNVLEELRNAGAEAVQVNGVRLTASSYFLDTTDGVEVDGQTLEAPYLWLAIGDPDTMTVALNIPGGALAGVRSEEGTTSVVSRDEVLVDAVRPLRRPVHATPVPPEDAG